MDVYPNSSVDGDIIYISNPVSTIGDVNHTVTKAVTANQQEWFEFLLDKGVESTNSFPDIIWVNIKATTRPGGGNIYGMVFNISLLDWRLGSHV